MTTNNPPEIPAGDLSLTAYIAAIASKGPTPGGGSVAGIVAALAAALAEMVANLSINRPSSADNQSELDAARRRAHEIQTQCLDLAQADAAAYSAYIAATRMPRGTTGESELRGKAIQVALVCATSVPTDLVGTCIDLLEILQVIAQHGNPHALSDVGAAAHFARAAALSALAVVRANAKLVKPPEVAEATYAQALYLERVTADAANALFAALLDRS